MGILKRTPKEKPAAEPVAKEEKKAAAPAMTPDQAMVYAALNAGVEA